MKGSGSPKVSEVRDAKSLQLCPTLFNPTDCSPPGSSLHGISQARILEWLLFPSPGGLPNRRIKPTSLMSPILVPPEKPKGSALTSLTQ